MNMVSLTSLRATRTIIGFALAIGIVALMVVAAVGTSPKARGGARTDLTSVDSPCGAEGGVRTTLSQLAGTLPFKLLVPDTTDANNKNSTGAYLCSPTSVALTFSNQVSILMELNSSADSRPDLRAFVAGDSAEASLTTVDGVDAALIDPARDPSGFARGSVTFVVGNLWVYVIGNHTLSADSLLAIANSLAPVG